MKKQTKAKIKTAIAITIISVAMIYAMKIGMERQTAKDCYEWKSWAEQSNLFKPDEQMLATCREVGINVK